MSKIDKVSTIKVYQADDYGWGGGDEVTAHGSADIFGYLDTWPQVRRKLGEPDVLVFTVQGGSDWAVDKTLKARQRLRVDYSDGSYEFWRIREVSINGHGGACQVTALPLWTDLGDRIFRWILAPTENVRYWVPMTAITVSDALARVFNEDYGINETQFQLGTVDASFASTVINISPNGVSHLEVIRQIINEVQIETDASCEFEITHSGDAVVFNFYTEAGWTAAERTAGTADATLRPIEAPTGGATTTEGNRRSMRITDAQDDYYSRIVPFGLDEDEQIGIDGTIWAVESVSTVFAGGEYTNTITLEGSPIWEDDCLNGYPVKIWRLDENYTRETITDCTAPNIIVVVDDRDLSAPPDTALTAEFMDSQGAPVTTEGFGTSLSFLPDQTAEADRGRVEKVIEYPDHPPFENLFDEHGGDADFSGTYNVISASKSLPAGMQSYPSSGEDANNTYASDTDAEYVHYGSKSFKVCAIEGQGAQTEEITLDVDPTKPYISVWCALRVETDENTAVRMEVVEIDDDTGDESTVWPTGTLKAESSDSNIKALYIEGIQPTNSKIRIRFTAQNADLPGTYGAVTCRTFYLDALVITNSATYYEYAPNMGKKGLWERAAAELLRSGGVRDDEYDGDLFDVGVYASSGSNAPITLGSHVTIKDLYDSAASTWRVSTTGRVVELFEDWSPLDGTIWKTVKVSKIRPTLADRFLRTPRKHETPVIPLQPKTSTTSDSGSSSGDPAETLEDAITGLSKLKRECGWVEIQDGNTESAKVQLSNSLPIVKGALKVTRVTEDESGTPIMWAVDSEYIRHNVFDIRLDEVDTNPNVFFWAWDYPCPLPLPSCWWDSLSSTNVILHVEFDEGAGQVAHDLSTGGYNVVFGADETEEGTDPSWVAEGIEFDGGDYAIADETNDKLGAGASNPLGAANFTVIVVAQGHDPNPSTDEHWIVSRGSRSGNTLNYAIYVKLSGGNPYVYGAFSDGVTTYELQGPELTDDEWYMFTLRYDGVNLKIARDRLSEEMTEARTETASTGNGDVYLGQNEDLTAGEYYSGKVAYLRIFDTALTDAQVRSEYDTIQCILSSRGTILEEIADLKTEPSIVWEASGIGNEETALSVSNPPRVVWQASTIATESDGDPWLYYFGPSNTGDAEEHKIYRRQPSDTAGTNIELVFSNDPEVPHTSRSNLGVYLPENVIGMVYAVSSGWVHEGDLSDGTTSIDIEDPESWANSIVEDPYTQEGRWQWYSDDIRTFCNFGGGTTSSLGNAGVGTGFPHTMRVDNRRGTLFTAKYHASGGQWIKAVDNWIHRGMVDVIAAQTYDPQYMDLDEEAGLLFFWDRTERSVYKVDYSDRDAWPVTPTKIVDHGAGTAVTANLCVDPVDQKVYYVFDGNLRECGYDGSGDTALWAADNVPHRLVRDGRTFGDSIVTLPLITHLSAVYWLQQMNLDGTGATVGVGRGAELNASFDVADFTYDNEYQRLLMATSGTSAGSIQINELSTGHPRSWITNYPSPQVTRFYAGVGWDDDYYYTLYSNEIFRIARSSDWDTQKAESSWTSVTTIGSGGVVGFAVVPAAQAYNSEMFFYNRGGNVCSNNSTDTSESTIGTSQNGGTADDYAIDVSPSNKISFTTANGNTVGVLVWTKGNGTSSGLRSVGLATFSPTVDPSTTAREEFITATSGEEVTHVQLDATNSKLYVLVKTASGLRLESYDLTTVASTDEVTISGKTTHQTISGTTWGDGYFNRFAIVEANV